MTEYVSSQKENFATHLGQRITSAALHFAEFLWPSLFICTRKFMEICWYARSSRFAVRQSDVQYGVERPFRLIGTLQTYGYRIERIMLHKDGIKRCEVIARGRDALSLHVGCDGKHTPVHHAPQVGIWASPSVRMCSRWRGRLSHHVKGGPLPLSSICPVAFTGCGIYRKGMTRHLRLCYRPTRNGPSRFRSRPSPTLDTHARHPKLLVT